MHVYPMCLFTAWCPNLFKHILEKVGLLSYLFL
jgi:hypothetical protein